MHCVETASIVESLHTGPRAPDALAEMDERFGSLSLSLSLLPYVPSVLPVTCVTGGPLSTLVRALIHPGAFVHMVSTRDRRGRAAMMAGAAGCGLLAPCLFWGQQCWCFETQRM